MKKLLILTLLTLSSFIGFSQNPNGGQFNENNSVRLQYIGYLNGIHTFKVKNKQNCNTTIRTRIDQEPHVDVPVLANDSFFVNIPRSTPDNVKFRVKSEIACLQNTDMGWVELNTSNFTLPLVDNNYINITRGENKFRVSVVGGVLRSDFGTLSIKQTIIMHNLTGEKLYFNRIYVNRNNQIDLNNFMKSGLNMITVFLDNSTQDFFTFKVYKN